LPADRRLRREVRWIITERTGDCLDGISEVVFLVGPHRHVQPLIEDTRAVLDGFVGRGGFVGALLQVGTPNALFEISIHLEIISDLLQFVPRPLLIFGVRCAVRSNWISVSSKRSLRYPSFG